MLAWLQRIWWPVDRGLGCRLLHAGFRLGILAFGVCALAGVPSPYEYVPIAISGILLLIDWPLDSQRQRRRELSG